METALFDSIKFHPFRICGKKGKMKRRKVINLTNEGIDFFFSPPKTIKWKIEPSTIDSLARFWCVNRSHCSILAIRATPTPREKHEVGLLHCPRINVNENTYSLVKLTKSVRQRHWKHVKLLRTYVTRSAGVNRSIRIDVPYSLYARPIVKNLFRIRNNRSIFFFFFDYRGFN